MIKAKNHTKHCLISFLTVLLLLFATSAFAVQAQTPAWKIYEGTWYWCEETVGYAELTIEVDEKDQLRRLQIDFVQLASITVDKLQYNKVNNAYHFEGHGTEDKETKSSGSIWFQEDSIAVRIEKSDCADLDNVRNKLLTFTREDTYPDEDPYVAPRTESTEADANAPFYGIFVYASRDAGDAYAVLESLSEAGGYNASVIDSSEWSNLNPEVWYCVTAGRYQTEQEANANLRNAQYDFADAYVKYSGTYIG